MSFVLDSSVTPAWIYAAASPEALSPIFERLLLQGAWVPSLWHLEVANVLLTGVRKGRHDSAFRDQTLQDLALLAINIDPDTITQAWHSTVQIAERYRLTAYDAAYLELAIRRTLPLATLDRELQAACLAESVPLLTA